MNKTQTTATDTTTAPAAQAAPAKQSLLTDVVKKELAALPNTSTKIRHLNAKGLTRGEIRSVMAEHLGRPDFKYQHVRNVLITPLKSQAK